MKVVVSLSLLCVFASNIFGMKNNTLLGELVDRTYDYHQDISHSVAKEWSDVEPFKDPVYMPFFEKNGYKKDYLEKRWTVLENFYKANLASIILLKKILKPVGFLTVEPKDENVLLYTSPILIEPKNINFVAFNAIKDLYPQVTTAYCMAQAKNNQLQEFLLKLGWKRVDESPIKPSKDFIENIPFVVFSHAVNHFN